MKYDRLIKILLESKCTKHDREMTVNQQTGKLECTACYNEDNLARMAKDVKKPKRRLFGKKRK